MPRYNGKSKLKEILKDEEAVLLVEKYFGREILNSPLLLFAKGMTVDAVIKYKEKLNGDDLEKAEKLISEIMALE